MPKTNTTPPTSGTMDDPQYMMQIAFTRLRERYPSMTNDFDKFKDNMLNDQATRDWAYRQLSKGFGSEDLTQDKFNKTILNYNVSLNQPPVKKKEDGSADGEDSTSSSNGDDAAKKAIETEQSVKTEQSAKVPYMFDGSKPQPVKTGVPYKPEETDKPVVLKYQTVLDNLDNLSQVNKDPELGQKYADDMGKAYRSETALLHEQLDKQYAEMTKYATQYDEYIAELQAAIDNPEYDQPKVKQSLVKAMEEKKALDAEIANWSKTKSKIILQSGMASATTTTDIEIALTRERLRNAKPYWDSIKNLETQKASLQGGANGSRQGNVISNEKAITVDGQVYTGEEALRQIDKKINETFFAMMADDPRNFVFYDLQGDKVIPHVLIRPNPDDFKKWVMAQVHGQEFADANFDAINSGQYFADSNGSWKKTFNGVEVDYVRNFWDKTFNDFGSRFISYENLDSWMQDHNYDTATTPSRQVASQFRRGFNQVLTKTLKAPDLMTLQSEMDENKKPGGKYDPYTKLKELTLPGYSFHAFQMAYKQDMDYMHVARLGNLPKEQYEQWYNDKKEFWGKAGLSEYEMQMILGIRPYDDLKSGINWAERMPLYQIADKWEQHVTANTVTNPRWNKNFWLTTMPNAAGSMTGYMALTTGGGAAGLPTMFTSGAFGTLMMIGTTFDEAIENGASMETALDAAFSPLNIIAGASEAVPMERFFVRLRSIPSVNNSMGKALLSFVSKAGGQGIEEGGQEFFQTVANNITAKEYYDFTRDVWQGVSESTKAGALLGMFMGSMTARVASGDIDGDDAVMVLEATKEAAEGLRNANPDLENIIPEWSGALADLEVAVHNSMEGKAMVKGKPLIVENGVVSRESWLDIPVGTEVETEDMVSTDQGPKAGTERIKGVVDYVGSDFVSIEITNEDGGKTSIRRYLDMDPNANIYADISQWNAGNKPTVKPEPEPEPEVKPEPEPEAPFKPRYAEEEANRKAAEEWAVQQGIDLAKYKEYGIHPISEYETTYRGTTMSEWEAIQQGGKSGTFTTPSKGLAENKGAWGGAEVVIEFKPEAKAKMQEGEEKFDSLEYYVKQEQDLSLDDVQKVTTLSGEVIYDADVKPDAEAEPARVMPGKASVNQIIELGDSVYRIAEISTDSVIKIEAEDGKIITLNLNQGQQVRENGGLKVLYPRTTNRQWNGGKKPTVKPDAEEVPAPTVADVDTLLNDGYIDKMTAANAKAYINGKVNAVTTQFYQKAFNEYKQYLLNNKPPIGGEVEIKNEGKADAPTKESVTKRLNIDNPFYKKVEDALVKLGLIEKYNPETGKGDVVGGYAQETSDGGFSAGKMLFSKDGSISYFDGDVKVSFDKNGNVISENTKEVKQKAAKLEIEGKKESIAKLEKTRDSEAFKYKEVTETDVLGNKKKVKRLKTPQELKESTDKINAAIDKAKAELAALEAKPTKDIEAKKAEIERRRQEELNSLGLKNFAFQASNKDISLIEYLNNRLENEKQNVDYLKAREPKTTKSIPTESQDYISDDLKHALRRLKEFEVHIENANKVNAKYDAKYVEAVKKGEITKEQAMQALEEVGRKNSAAYAELAALEAKPTKDIEAKKADIERRRQELESSREIETLYDLTKPIVEDSKEIISKIEEANKLKKEAAVKREQAAKETNEERKIALNSAADSLYEKVIILDKEVKTSRDSVINNTPIKQAIKSAKILGQRLLNKIKLAAKSNEWVSSMPISKEEFTKLEDATKRLSVKDMGEVTSNSEVIPDILLIEEINAKYEPDDLPPAQGGAGIEEKPEEFKPMWVGPGKAEVNQVVELAGEVYRVAEIVSDDVVRILSQQGESFVVNLNTAELFTTQKTWTPQPIANDPKTWRKYGKRVVDGITTYERQGDVIAATGDMTNSDNLVKFADKVLIPYQWAIIDASNMQPSHINGVRNPMFFIPEAQPKERTDDASKGSAEDIARNPRFEELSDAPNAYSGAPIINSRGEVIQGNNRTAGIINHYRNGDTKYRNDLVANLSKYGLTEDQIKDVESPVLVRLVNVTDEQAINLGNYDVKDIESGGNRRIDPVPTAARVSAEDKVAIMQLLQDESTTLNAAIRDNFSQLLKKLSPAYINEAQVNSMFNSNGEPKKEAVADVEALVKEFLFGGNPIVRQQFESLPANIKTSLEKSILPIFEVSEGKRLLPHIHNAIAAVSEYEASGMDDFDIWSRQGSLIGEAPILKYIPVELAIAKKMNEAKTQKEIIGMFKAYAQATKDAPADLLNPAKPGLNKVDAIKQVFGVDFTPGMVTPTNPQQLQEALETVEQITERIQQLAQELADVIEELGSMWKGKDGKPKKQNNERGDVMYTQEERQEQRDRKSRIDAELLHLRDMLDRKEMEGVDVEGIVSRTVDTVFNKINSDAISIEQRRAVNDEQNFRIWAQEAAKDAVTTFAVDMLMNDGITKESKVVNDNTQRIIDAVLEKILRVQAPKETKPKDKGKKSPWDRPKDTPPKDTPPTPEQKKREADEKASEARRKLEELLKKRRDNNRNHGVFIILPLDPMRKAEEDLAIISAGIEYGASLVRQGYYSFAVWAKKMLQDLADYADVLRPLLQDVWESYNEDGVSLEEISAEAKSQNPGDEITDIDEDAPPADEEEGQGDAEPGDIDTSGAIAVIPADVTIAPGLNAPNRNFKLLSAAEVGVVPAASGRAKANNAAEEILRKIQSGEKNLLTMEDIRTLSSYTGRGNMPEYQDGKEFEHYTPNHVYSAIYENLNYIIESDTIKRFIEPAAGVGRAYWAMPKRLREAINSGKIEAISIDLPQSDGLRISKLINGPVKHFAAHKKLAVSVPGIEGYLEGNKDRKADLIVTNVPFDSRTKMRGVSLHDGFILASLDLLNPGGIGVFITSSSTADKQATGVREMMVNKADVISVIPLSTSTFKDSNTSVPTDVIFFRKPSRKDAALRQKISTLSGVARNELLAMDSDPNLNGDRILDGLSTKGAKETVAKILDDFFPIEGNDTGQIRNRLALSTIAENIKRQQVNDMFRESKKAGGNSGFDLLRSSGEHSNKYMRSARTYIENAIADRGSDVAENWKTVKSNEQNRVSTADLLAVVRFLAKDAVSKATETFPLSAVLEANPAFSLVFKDAIDESPEQREQLDKMTPEDAVSYLAQNDTQWPLDVIARFEFMLNEVKTKPEWQESIFKNRRLNPPNVFVNELKSERFKGVDIAHTNTGARAVFDNDQIILTNEEVKRMMDVLSDAAYQPRPLQVGGYTLKPADSLPVGSIMYSKFDEDVEFARKVSFTIPKLVSLTLDSLKQNFGEAAAKAIRTFDGGKKGDLTIDALFSQADVNKSVKMQERWSKLEAEDVMYPKFIALVMQSFDKAKVDMSVEKRIEVAQTIYQWFNYASGSLYADITPEVVKAGDTEALISTIERADELIRLRNQINDTTSTPEQTTNARSELNYVVSGMVDSETSLMSDPMINKYLKTETHADPRYYVLNSLNNLITSPSGKVLSKSKWSGIFRGDVVFDRQKIVDTTTDLISAISRQPGFNGKRINAESAYKFLQVAGDVLPLMSPEVQVAINGTMEEFIEAVVKEGTYMVDFLTMDSIHLMKIEDYAIGNLVDKMVAIEDMEKLSETVGTDISYMHANIAKTYILDLMKTIPSIRMEDYVFNTASSVVDIDRHIVPFFKSLWPNADKNTFEFNRSANSGLGRWKVRKNAGTAIIVSGGLMTKRGELTQAHMERWFNKIDEITEERDANGNIVYIQKGNKREPKMIVDTEGTQERNAVFEKAFNNWIQDMPDAEKAHMQAELDSKYKIFTPKSEDAAVEIRGLSSTFKGKPLLVNPWQWKAVRAYLRNLRQYTVHAVGAGKTMTAVLQAMAAKDRGMIKKPMVVVPLKTMPQWKETIRELFPEARVVEVKSENRHQALADLAVNNYDFVLVSDSTLKEQTVKLSAAKQVQYMREELSPLQNALDDIERRIVLSSDRQEKNLLERQKRKLIDTIDRIMLKIQNLIDRNQNEGVMTNFDNLGIDALLVDEADQFKNVITPITDFGDVKGITASDSPMAINMRFLTRYVQEKSGDKNVSYYTATPVSNSATEIYQALNSIAPDVLKGSGIFTFSDFVNEFGEIKAKEMVKSSGDIAAVNVFDGVKNLPALHRMLKSVFDVILQDDMDGIMRSLGVPIPKNNLVEHRLELTPERELSVFDSMALARIVKALAKLTPAQKRMRTQQAQTLKTNLEIAQKALATAIKTGQTEQAEALRQRIEDLRVASEEFKLNSLTFYGRVKNGIIHSRLYSRFISDVHRESSKVREIARVALASFNFNADGLKRTIIDGKGYYEIPQENGDVLLRSINGGQIFFANNYTTEDQPEFNAVQDYIDLIKEGLPESVENPDLLFMFINKDSSKPLTEKKLVELLAKYYNEEEAAIAKNNIMASLTEYEMEPKMMENEDGDMVPVLDDDGNIVYQENEASTGRPSTRMVAQYLFNEGKVRFLFGSTESMGVGMNLQGSTTDIHHIDMPFRPRDFIQRNGRGVRQGNRNYKVDVHTYVSEGGPEALVLQLMRIKEKFISTLFDFKLTEGYGEDIGTIQTGETSADESVLLNQLDNMIKASHDPRVRQFVEMMKEVEVLMQRLRSYVRRLEQDTAFNQEVERKEKFALNQQEFINTYSAISAELEERVEEQSQKDKVFRDAYREATKKDSEYNTKLKELTDRMEPFMNSDNPAEAADANKQFDLEKRKLNEQYLPVREFIKDLTAEEKREIIKAGLATGPNAVWELSKILYPTEDIILAARISGAMPAKPAEVGVFGTNTEINSKLGAIYDYEKTWYLEELVNGRFDNKAKSLTTKEQFENIKGSMAEQTLYTLEDLKSAINITVGSWKRGYALTVDRIKQIRDIIDTPEYIQGIAVAKEQLAKDEDGHPMIENKILEMMKAIEAARPAYSRFIERQKAFSEYAHYLMTGVLPYITEEQVVQVIDDWKDLKKKYETLDADGVDLPPFIEFVAENRSAVIDRILRDAMLAREELAQERGARNDEDEDDDGGDDDYTGPGSYDNTSTASPNTVVAVGSSGEKITLSQISRNFVHNLGAKLGWNIRAGHKGARLLPKTTLGRYYLNNMVVRLRGNLSDFQTLAHEIGHGLDLGYFGFSKLMTAPPPQRPSGYSKRQIDGLRTLLGTHQANQIPQEVVDYLEALKKWEDLQIMAEELITADMIRIASSGGYSGITRGGRIKEGLAEFVRKYIMDPEQAQREHPTFILLFEQMLNEAAANGDAHLKYAMTTARAEYQMYRNNPAYLRDVATMRDNTKKPSISEMAGGGGINEILNNVRGMWANWTTLLKLNMYSQLYAWDETLRLPIVRDMFKELNISDKAALQDRQVRVKSAINQIAGIGGIFENMVSRPYRRIFTNDGDVRSQEQFVPVPIKPLKDILRPFIDKGLYHAFELYLKDLRLAEYDKRGLLIKNGFPIQITDRDLLDIYERIQYFEQLIDNELGADMAKEAAKDMSEWTKLGLYYMMDSGMITQDEFNAMTTLNPFYVPFSTTTDENFGRADAGNYIGGTDMDIADPLRGIKPIDLANLDVIESPIDMAEKNMLRQINEANKNVRNMAMVHLLHELQEAAKDNNFPSQMVLIQRIPSKEVVYDPATKTFVKRTVNPADKGMVVIPVFHADAYDAGGRYVKNGAIKFQDLSNKYPDPDSIPYQTMIKGQKADIEFTYYQIPKQLHDWLKFSEKDDILGQTWIITANRAISRAFRKMVVRKGLSFVTRNPPRDAQSAMLYTKYARYNPMIDPFAAIAKTMQDYFADPKKMDDISFLMNAAGADLSASVLWDEKGHIKYKPKTVGQKVKGVLNPFSDDFAIDRLAEASEMFNRRGVFWRVYNETGRTDLAAIDARNSAGDFFGKRKGRMSRFLDAFHPFKAIQFWHLAFQLQSMKRGMAGTYNMIKTLATEGKVDKDRHAIALWWSILTYTSFDMLCYFAQTLGAFWDDDDEKEYRRVKYQERASWAKYGITYIPIWGGRSIPMPKSPMNILFSSGIQSWLNSNDEEVVNERREWLKMVNQQFMPYNVFFKPEGKSTIDFVQFAPFVFTPWLESQVNYDSFRNAPVTPIWMKDLNKELQYTSQTPMLYRHLSELSIREHTDVNGVKTQEARISPLEIQHIIEGYTSGVGRWTASVASMVTDGKVNDLEENGEYLLTPRFWQSTYGQSMGNYSQSADYIRSWIMAAEKTRNSWNEQFEKAMSAQSAGDEEMVQEMEAYMKKMMTNPYFVYGMSSEMLTGDAKKMYKDNTDAHLSLDISKLKKYLSTYAITYDAIQTNYGGPALNEVLRDINTAMTLNMRGIALDLKELSSMPTDVRSPEQLKKRMDLIEKINNFDEQTGVLQKLLEDKQKEDAIK